jgi:hypothetical protein
VDAVLAAREPDRRQGADDQQGCRNEPHRQRIGSDPDGLKKADRGKALR